jgi:hypothetical protein
MSKLFTILKILLAVAIWQGSFYCLYLLISALEQLRFQ